MKNGKVFQWLWVLVVLTLALMQRSVAAVAQERPSPNTPMTPQQYPDSMSQQQTSTLDESEDFTTLSGKILKSGDKFVLQDSIGESTYQLDDQQRAKDFEGMNVKVTGAIDKVSKSIRVTKIEPEQ